MGFGLGLRSKRFVVVAEAGIVKHVLVDEGSESLQAGERERERERERAREIDGWMDG